MFDLFDPRSELIITTGSNLPHWYQPGATYFVTFRTEDSIPRTVAQSWRQRRQAWLQSRGVTARTLSELTANQQREFHESYSQEYLDWLDRGLGECLFRQSEFAKIIGDSLLHFNAKRYNISHFVVMPNHVHVLCGLIGTTEIEAQCCSWKKFTAGKLNRILGRTGRFWQEESFDHLVRSPDQFLAIQKYIIDNPRHAGLALGEFLVYARPAS